MAPLRPAPRRRAGPVRALCADASGAMVIEATLVYLPVALFFFLIWQVGELAAADLVLARAASAASRQAVVVLPDDPRHHGGEPVLDTRGERRRAAIAATAREVLWAAPSLDPGSLELELELARAPGAPGGVVLVDTRLRADFRCGGGGLSLIVCGASGRRTLRAAARDVVHTARYEYSSGATRGRDAAARAPEL